jgi:hypothetical protein
MQNAAVQIGGKNFGEQRENVELHIWILAGSGMSGKRVAHFTFMKQNYCETCLQRRQGLTPI